jgi:short-subunit dehydrogenase
LNLASKGANLVLSSRSKDKLDILVRECKAKYSTCQVISFPLDVEKYLDAEQSYKTLSKDLKEAGMQTSIDVLINNAGISSRGDILSTSIDTTEKLLRVNFLGPVALTQAVLPDMITKGGGAVAVISSVQGKIGVPFRSSYAGQFSF